ncbi:nucleoside phosphorylase domain-containing protein [Colletotrichum phormii]|uniref:Nucleoside phosphorylase domain-containing protein n=1 Tax=Colletotrichum phormii TaxID=359342 RepID=A0AAJ0A228_9PEZI|nr:nucleoside phosphorylase domain-containing protein [Colletotrichum phormii]KAK1655047.1 nucleoside phosphorylase domain-containing protein [Colletotrichum phormii]
MAHLDYNNYKVAWIAPLEIEARAAMCMLDVQHTGRFPVRVGHDYNFIAGRMCGHNVVIGTFPLGKEYGIASAAALASQMKLLFPKLWFTLLVGVAAGLPSLKRDIRLGDVLVALSDGEVPAIVPYGLGKETSEGLNLIRGGRSQNQTQTIVGSAVGRIKVSDPEGLINGFLDHFKAMQDERHSNGDFKDPGQPQDELIGTNTIGERVVVPREPRPNNAARTKVWYGPLGSGDKLMKNAEKRDALRDQYSIIGLEMEAAGIMNRLAVGVIRGVCDYGDEQKKKEWQPYAAAMAAAYAKEVLKEISVVESDSDLHIRKITIVPSIYGRATH